jgi:hypothetical protein
MSCHYLRTSQQLDLLLSSDALPYKGDLAPVLAAASAALRRGGFFAFTVDALEHTKVCPPCHLFPLDFDTDAFSFSEFLGTLSITNVAYLFCDAFLFCRGKVMQLKLSGVHTCTS